MIVGLKKTSILSGVLLFATLCGRYAESLPGLDSFNPFVIP